MLQLLPQEHNQKTHLGLRVFQFLLFLLNLHFKHLLHFCLHLFHFHYVLPAFLLHLGQRAPEEQSSSELILNTCRRKPTELLVNRRMTGVLGELPFGLGSVDSITGDSSQFLAAVILVVNIVGDIF